MPACGAGVMAGEDAANAAVIAALTVALASMVAALGADLPSNSTAFAKSLGASFHCMLLSVATLPRTAARSDALAAMIFAL